VAVAASRQGLAFGPETAGAGRGDRQLPNSNLDSKTMRYVCTRQLAMVAAHMKKILKVI
jgi:hypothetical protein